jgi:hypothetical protein
VYFIKNLAALLEDFGISKDTGMGIIGVDIKLGREHRSYSILVIVLSTFDQVTNCRLAAAGSA